MERGTCGGWRVRGCMLGAGTCEGEQGWEHFPGTDSLGLRWRAPRAPALRDGAEGTHAKLVGRVRAQAALGAARHADLLARHRARPLGRLLLRLLAPLQVVVRGAASHRRDPVDVEAQSESCPTSGHLLRASRQLFTMSKGFIRMRAIGATEMARLASLLVLRHSSCSTRSASTGFLPSSMTLALVAHARRTTTEDNTQKILKYGVVNQSSEL